MSFYIERQMLLPIVSYAREQKLHQGTVQPARMETAEDSRSIQLSSRRQRSCLLAPQERFEGKNILQSLATVASMRN